jgi:hypothetical protein
MAGARLAGPGAALCARLRSLPVALIVVGLLIPTAWIGYRDAASREALYHLFYSHAVASKCGTLTPAAQRGFDLLRARALQASDIAPETIRELRVAGGVAADREWLNRGLGGYRHWCVSEGRSAALRLAAG